MEIIKKIVKFVIAPLVFILGVIVLLKEWFIGDSSEKLVDKTRDKDIKLKEEADKAKTLADKSLGEANEIAKKRDNTDGDPDWDL